MCLPPLPPSFSTCCAPDCLRLQVLSAFALPRLAGEGDVVRTLGRLGYKLGHEQDPRRELDFAGEAG